LHAKFKARLIEEVTAAIPRIHVEHGRYVDRYELLAALRSAEAALPDKGALKDQLTAYVDYENAFTEFVSESISEELRQLPFDQDPSKRPLSAFDGYGDSKIVAERLLECFEALPRKYTLGLQLPSAFSSLMADRTLIELASNVRIVKANPDLSNLYPYEPKDAIPAEFKIGGLLANLSVGLLGSGPQAWEEGGLYLQIDALGFIGFYGGTNPHEEAVRTIKAFCGLGIALRLFEMKSEHFSLTPPSRLQIHRQDSNGSFKFQCSINLDENVSRGLSALTLHTINGWINSEQRQILWADGVFATIRSVFAGGKKADSILLASQWFFDGHSHGPNPLLKFIQTMVVLEILLGDKASSEQTGLNVLLGNRCAYLIGASQEERTEVLSLFSEIYAVRSQIVHRGKHRLSLRERVLFQNLRWMCCRVIYKEAELLKADNKNLPAAPP
jgi:hypothetical protein